MIYVCNIREMPDHVCTLQPSRLVSVVAPDEMPATPPGIDADRHLRVGVDDICEPFAGQVVPEAHHVDTIVRFLSAWDPGEPILVHCIAGISRSMATALIAMVLRAEGEEQQAAARLRSAAPHAQPNRLIVALADRLLARDGRLIAARDSMGSATAAYAGPLVPLPVMTTPAASAEPALAVL